MDGERGWRGEGPGNFPGSSPSRKFRHLLEPHHVLLRLLGLGRLGHRHREVVETLRNNCRIARRFVMLWTPTCPPGPPIPMPIPLSMGGNMSASVPPDRACSPRQAIIWAMGSPSRPWPPTCSPNSACPSSCGRSGWPSIILPPPCRNSPPRSSIPRPMMGGVAAGVGVCSPGVELGEPPESPGRWGPAPGSRRKPPEEDGGDW